MGLGRVATVEGRKTGSPWSLVLHVDTDAGVELFFKAVRNHCHHEIAITQLLNDSTPGHVPTLLSTNGDKGWMLIASAGRTLREFGNDSTRGDKVSFALVLREFASLQIEAVELVGNLIECGYPGRQYKSSSQWLQAAENEIAGILEAHEGNGIRENWRERLERQAALLTDLLAPVDESAVPRSLGIMTSNQPMLVYPPRGAKSPFFDWEQLSLTVPF